MYEEPFLFLGKCIPGGLEVSVLCPQCTDILYNFCAFKIFFPYGICICQEECFISL